MQREIALLAEMTKELKRLDDRLVSKCCTEQAAFRLCINQAPSYYTQQFLADELGVTKGALNMILNSDMTDRPRHLPRRKQEDLQAICRNTAIDQWAALYRTGSLDCQKTKTDRKAELLKELAELEASA